MADTATPREWIFSGIFKDDKGREWPILDGPPMNQGQKFTLREVVSSAITTSGYLSREDNPPPPTIVYPTDCTPAPYDRKPEEYEALKSEVERLTLNVQAVSKHNLAMGKERDAYREALEASFKREHAHVLTSFDTPEEYAAFKMERFAQYDTSQEKK